MKMSIFLVPRINDLPLFSRQLRQSRQLISVIGVIAAKNRSVPGLVCQENALPFRYKALPPRKTPCPFGTRPCTPGKRLGLLVQGVVLLVQGLVLLVQGLVPKGQRLVQELPRLQVRHYATDRKPMT